MGPIAESIVVASILPKDWTYVSLEELEHTQLNASIVNLLRSFLCKDLQDHILENKSICRDAHLIWALLVEIFVNAKWDEDVDEDEDEDEPVEECSTSTTTNTEPQESIFKEEEGRREEDFVPLEEAVKPPQ